MRCANPKCKKKVRPRAKRVQGRNPAYCSEACSNAARQQRWRDRAKTIAK